MHIHYFPSRHSVHNETVHHVCHCLLVLDAKSFQYLFLSWNKNVNVKNFHAALTKVYCNQLPSSLPIEQKITIKAVHMTLALWRHISSSESNISGARHWHQTTRQIWIHKNTNGIWKLLGGRDFRRTILVINLSILIWNISAVTWTIFPACRRNYFYSTFVPFWNMIKKCDHQPQNIFCV